MSPVKKGHMQLRARTKADMTKLIKAFPEQLKQAKIIETNQADYRWRIVMTPSKWIVLAMKLAEDIDYGNFKNAAAANGIDTHPHHEVWAIMMDEQRRERRMEQESWQREALPGLRDIDPRDDEAEPCPECGGQEGSHGPTPQIYCRACDPERQPAK